METYTGTKLLIRISHADENVIHSMAEEIALVTATRLGMQGANIRYGHDFWRPEEQADFDVEFGATIEIVKQGILEDESLQVLRNHVTAAGLTAFVTVERVKVAELY